MYVHSFTEKDTRFVSRINSVFKSALDDHCKEIKTNLSELIDFLLRQYCDENNVRIGTEFESEYGEDWIGENTDKHLWKRI